MTIMAHPIVIPRLGWSMEQGTFLGWLKTDGAQVSAGEPLFELEGEKSAQEIEAVDEGILRIPPNAPQPGSIVEVGSTIGYLAAEDELSPWLVAPADQTRSEIQAEAAPSPAPGATRTEAPSDPTRHHVHASPRARRVARELGVDWRNLTGGGSSGRVREQDVRAAANRADDSSDVLCIPISPRRRTIALRLAAGREPSVPIPVTLTTRADVSPLVVIRDQWKTRSDGTAPCPSYQDMILALVAATLPTHPLLGARWAGSAIAVPARNRFDMGFAIDTPDGLLVAAVRDVGSLALSAIAQKTRWLIERARAGRLTAAETEGTVFTLTNLGAFGIDAFTPVLHDHQAAILGLGAIRREPVFLDDGSLSAQHRMVLSLTFDHRIVDGAPAARFLQDLVNSLHQPPAWLASDQPPGSYPA